MNESPGPLVKDPFVFVGIVLLILIVVLVSSSCSIYRESFTHEGTPEAPGHSVEVLHLTFFQFGEAGRLTTETQTMEFIRTVNAENVRAGTDGEALGVAAGEILKRASGRP